MKLANYIEGAALLLLSATAAMAQTTRPSEVPQVTVTATTKLLIFDWKPVPGATYYQLYVNADGHSGFSPAGGHIAAPGTRAGYSIATHLQHWQDALYRLSACNAAGCRDSKSLFPRRHMLETIGYFKASNPDTGDNFGSVVELSGDGSTMAVTAPNEASNATGINGDQTDNSLYQSGAVYVYRKVAGHWTQEAYLKAPDNQNYRSFGQSVSLTTDGSTLVVGGVSSPSLGTVLTYRRASTGTWSLESSLPSPGEDGFGRSVKVSGDGRTLHVFADGPYTKDGREGMSYLYTRSGATGAWKFAQSILAVHGGLTCAMQMSGDASTVTQLCNYEGGDGVLVTLKRTGSTWSKVNDLYDGDYVGSLAMNNDASRLALTRPGTSGLFVRVYRWTNGAWLAEGDLPDPIPTSTYSDWGSALNFNGNGWLLAVADARNNPPKPPGISEELAAGTPGTNGSVFIYQRSEAGGAVSWNFRAEVNAPNPDAGDAFGSSVALSGTGSTLAVGANGESSKAPGINGDQADDSARSAGAAYLY